MNAEQYGRAAFQAQAYDERVYGTSISLPSAYDYTWHRGDNGMAVLDGVKVAEFLNADQTVRGVIQIGWEKFFRPLFPIIIS